jgi:flagellar export protein FliJ
MRPFRFRAAAALDLQIKEEDRARQRLAEAQSAYEATQQRASDAQRAARDAAEQSIVTASQGAEGWRLSWHQSWIHRLRLEADACQRATAVSAATVATATASVHIAHRKRRTLERLRDRAMQRYRIESERQHSRDMNELASLRFTSLAAERGGHDE